MWNEQEHYAEDPFCSGSVSVTWRRGAVFLRKMKPKSCWTSLSDRRNSLLPFHSPSRFYLPLSHSEKTGQDFLKLHPAPFLNPISNLSRRTVSSMRYPISLCSSHEELSRDRSDPSESTSCSPKPPIIIPSEKWVRKNTVLTVAIKSHPEMQFSTPAHTPYTVKSCVSPRLNRKPISNSRVRLTHISVWESALTIYFPRKTTLPCLTRLLKWIETLR